MLFGNSVSICLAIVVICYFFWNFCQKVFFIKKLDILPGPKTLPLIGSIYHFLLTKDIMEIMFKLTDDYPSRCQVWMGSKLFVGIYKPDEVKTVLNSRNCIDKSMVYKFVTPSVFRSGLVVAPASVWTRIRTMTAPTFSSLMLQSFFNKFVEESVTLTNELEKIELNGDEILIQEYILNCTWKIACESIVGVKMEPNKNNQCVKAVQRVKKIIYRRIMNVCIYYFDSIFNLTPLGRILRRNVNLINSLIDEMIQQRIAELKNQDVTKGETKQNYKTFFDIQMDACRKQNITKQEIHDNIMTLLIAASDTIAVTMNFVIFMLANFPEIQEKVCEELFEIYGIESVKPTSIKYDDLQHMHYLDRVIKETMRIFPPIPLFGRQVTKDLKIGDVVLPKGTDIIVGILKIHRDEEYWPNPLVFDPDRFLPERMKNYHSCYLPFSDGPRNCIGMKYGIMCLKVMLATLVRTFKFKVDKTIEINRIKLKFNVVLSTEKPLKVKIEKRCFQ